jgi:aminoglycoside phosphotransferase
MGLEPSAPGRATPPGDPEVNRMAARHPTSQRHHQLDAACLLWLSAAGLGSAEVLAVVSNAWLAQQTLTGLREFHLALEERHQRTKAGDAHQR